MTDRDGHVDLGSAAEIPGMARAEAREPDFLRKGRLPVRTMLREAARYGELRRTPYGFQPIVVLTIIGLFSALNGGIFGAARPEIQRDLEISLPTIAGIVAIISFFLIFAGIGMAYLADRWPRKYFIAFGSIFQGLSSLIVGTSRTVPMISSGLAVTATAATIQAAPNGLIADSYPPEVRGKAYALYGVLGNLVTLTLPLTIAYLATATSLKWRFPYFLTGPALVVVGLLSLVILKEPIRGYMERRSLGESEEVSRRAEEPPSIGEAWRTVWSIRTQRRLFVAEIVSGVGANIYGLAFAVLLFEKYGLGIRERALLFTLLAFTALPFGFLAGGMVDVLIRRRPQRVLLATGAISVTAAPAVLLFSATPPLWVLAAVFVVYGWAGSIIRPARQVLSAQIIPAHVRSLGGSVFDLAGIPATLLQFAVISFAFTRYGTAGALAFAAPFYLIGGFVEMSAAGFFERDMRAAFASQTAAADWRRAQESGTGKMLVCRDVDVEYDGVQVLFGVDFDVEEGQLIALLGTNGAGKSTLLKAIAGIQEASSGAIVYNGRDITHMPPHEIARRGIVLMPGGRGVFPSLTVRDNLRLGGWVDDEGFDERLQEVYSIFPVLRQRADDRAQVLSGGEQQMLSLAQAFLARPAVLMIDELSLGLSPAVVQQLLEIVRRIHASGTTIIMVEQSVNVALTVAERAVFMEKGEIRFIGPTAELLQRPDILRAVYVKGTGALTDVPASERRRRQQSLGERRNVLEAIDVTKTYGGVTAVDDVSIALRDGEVLGLIGPNGAGKTTLFELISGYQKPDAGRIVLEGADVTTMGPDERARLRLVRRFQDARLFGSLTVYENLLVALDQRLDIRSIALTALQLPQIRQSERRIRTRADRLIEVLELGAFRDKFARELSTGLRRIADLACVLAADPRVLLLDEPSSGIAQAESESLGPLLRRVQHEIGCSILIIEHDMPLISRVSDELVAMDQGRVVTRGLPEDVLNDDRVVEAYLGTSEDAIQRSGART